MAAYQGTIFKRTFNFTDTDDVAVDITGWTFEAQVRVAADDDDALLTLTTANGGFTIVGSAVDGRVEMTITADQTDTLPEGRVIFDVLRTDITPGPLWLFAAKFPVKQPVTRDE